MAEVMSIGRILSGTHIVIVFNTEWIFIADHLRSHWLNFLILYEVRNINDSYVSELVSKNELTFDGLIVLLEGVVG